MTMTSEGQLNGSSEPISVSRFFRDPHSFEVLSAFILPELFRKKFRNRDHSFKVWSAGCARGEEPYSVAILLKEALEQGNRPMEIQIFATDINAAVLKAAEDGIYDTGQVGNVKYGLLKKYFRPLGNMFELLAEIREMVSFSCYDMADSKTYVPPDSVFGHFDLILCRNLLIYLGTDLQRAVVAKLHRALSPGGCLVLGQAEGLMERYRNRFLPRDMYGRIYTKQN